MRKLLLFCLLMPHLSALAAPDITVVLRHQRGAVHTAEATGDFGGGNVTASIGPDGIVLADTMFAHVMPKLHAAMRAVPAGPARLVINSHFHGDHAEGNASAGPGAIVMAQQATARRLPGGYPVVAFEHSATLRMNGEQIRVVHVPASHTDGDAFIYFEQARVLHLGDLYFEGMFPGVYRDSGGDIGGLIRTLHAILRDYPADTIVVPGHGPVGTMATLAAYVRMLEETVAVVQKGKRAGQDADAMARDPVFVKYAPLGDGGGQSVHEYISMLARLLQ